MFRGNLLCFSLCPWPLVLSLGTTEESLAQSSLHPHFRYLYTFIRCLCAFSSPGWTVPDLSAFPRTSPAPDCYMSLWPFVALSPVCPSLSSPELDTVLQLWPHHCWAEGKDQFPRPAGNTLPSAAWDTIGLLCFKGTLLAHVQLSVHQDSHVFCKAAFLLGGSQHILVHRVVPPQIQDFPLLNLNWIILYFYTYKICITTFK